MSNDEQKTNELQEVPVQTPTLVASTEADETALKLTAIESEKPSGEAAGNTPAAEAEPQSAEQANEPQLDEAKEPTTAALVNVPEPSQPKPSKVAGLFTSKKQAVIAAVMAGVLVLGGGAAAFALLYQAPVPEVQLATPVQSKPVAKMGVAVTVADGTVTYQKASGGEWAPLTTETQLAEGSQVKTAAESRAVLLFDDGSALRLDANTTVGLTSLAADDIKIAQIDGMAYSRVVASKRSYTVGVDGINYKALGTAFSTVKSQTEKGVRVFQSQVKVDGVETAVAEGKQYFNDNANASLKDKVTDIDVDAMADSAFVKWNLTEDEKAENFKNKLGILGKVKERAEQKVKEQEKDSDHETKDKVTRGTMSLTRSGETFTWSYTGKAIHGYKLVYSKSNPTPTFGTDDAIYFGSIGETSGSLPDKRKTGGGGTYYVRVCAYTAGSEDEPCVDYSPVISFTR